MSKLAVFTIIGLLALTFVLPLQGEQRHYQDAVILQSAEYDWCNHDCAPSRQAERYFFCRPNGQTKIYLQWRSRKRTGVPAAWMPDSIQMFERTGSYTQYAGTTSLAYDDRSIWVKNGGSETHLSRDYSEDVFTKPECTAEIHKNWLKEFESIRRPTTERRRLFWCQRADRPPIPTLRTQTGLAFFGLLGKLICQSVECV